MYVYNLHEDMTQHLEKMKPAALMLWNILDSFRALILYNLIERGNKKEKERERNRKKLRIWLDQFEKQGYAS